MVRSRTFAFALAIGALFALAAVSACRSQAAAQSAQETPAPSQSVRTISYFVGEGDPASGYLAADRDLATWALEAWQRSAAGGIQLKESSEQAALVRLYWALPNGRAYGEMQPIAVNGVVGAAVFVRPDVSAFSPEISGRAVGDPLWRDTIVYLTCLHELGHAFGLTHTADVRDIMYSFTYGGDIVEYFSRYRRRLARRQDIRDVSGLSNADVERVRALHPTS